jgi:hypothetical protein
MSKITNILFILGATNSGKTTFINEVCKNESKWFKKGFHPIVIGQKLRKMFPPEYFEGQGAPAKTDEIAFKLMMEGINEAISLDKIPVIDGQPRNQRQLEWCTESLFSKNNCIFCHLWAPRETREMRAKKRDSDPGKLKLSMERMDSDSIILYDIWCHLTSKSYNTFIIDTSQSNYMDISLQRICSFLI